MKTKEPREIELIFLKNSNRMYEAWNKLDFNCYYTQNFNKRLM